MVHPDDLKDWGEQALGLASMFDHEAQRAGNLALQRAYEELALKYRDVGVASLQAEAIARSK